MQADTPPNQTIYINNLNEKIKKEGAHSSLLSCKSPLPSFCFIYGGAGGRGGGCFFFSCVVLVRHGCVEFSSKTLTRGVLREQGSSLLAALYAGIEDPAPMSVFFLCSFLVYESAVILSSFRIPPHTREEVKEDYPSPLLHYSTIYSLRFVLSKFTPTSSIFSSSTSFEKQ